MAFCKGDDPPLVFGDYIAVDGYRIDCTVDVNSPIVVAFYQIGVDCGLSFDEATKIIADKVVRRLLAFDGGRPLKSSPPAGLLWSIDRAVQQLAVDLVIKRLEETPLASFNEHVDIMTLQHFEQY